MIRTKKVKVSSDSYEVIGLDLSLTATGVATPLALKTIKTMAVMSMGERLSIIRGGISRSVDAAVANGGRALLVIEAVPTHAAFSIAPLAMIHGVMHLWAFHNEVPLLLVSPPALKKFGTGKGNATKPDMRMSLFQRAQIDLRDDNQVDAWWLYALGYELLGTPLVELPKVHTEHLIKGSKKGPSLKDQLTTLLG